jgi:nickel transport system ATP-binding protein
MKNALIIDDLTVISGGPQRGKKILDGISFKVAQGRTLALVGESGCGKTMTSMAVMGLLPAGIHKTCGKIIIGENDTSELNGEQYRKLRNKNVSIVMQNPMSAFNPILNIYHHFSETITSHSAQPPLQRTREIKEKALTLLAEVGFPNPQAILEMYPFQMSGGMLQRVMLAIALSESAPFLIADEATTDLDVVSQYKILELLKSHCAKHHAALLLITHDFGVAAKLADDIVLLKEGKIVEQESVENFFNNPESDYARALLKYHRGLYSPRYKKIIENIGRAS